MFLPVNLFASVSTKLRL